MIEKMRVKANFNGNKILEVEILPNNYKDFDIDELLNMYDNLKKFSKIIFEPDKIINHAYCANKNDIYNFIRRTKQIGNDNHNTFLFYKREIIETKLIISFIIHEGVKNLFYEEIERFDIKNSFNTAIFIN